MDNLSVCDMVTYLYCILSLTFYVGGPTCAAGYKPQLIRMSHRGRPRNS